MVPRAQRRRLVGGLAGKGTLAGVVRLHGVQSLSTGLVRAARRARMVEIMGGRDKVLADLESFFENTPREFYWNPYYNHANEPVHHCLSSSTA